MKKIKFAMFSALLVASLGITACSGKKSETDTADTTVSELTAADTTVSEVTVAETTDEESSSTTADTTSAEDETLTEKENTEYYRRYARFLQAIIGTKNMEDLSELFVYPSYIGIDDGITVNNKDEFMALDADKVFTDELIEAVNSADVDSIDLSEAGFVMAGPSGKPSVTFGLDKEGSIGITRIDY